MPTRSKRSSSAKKKAIDRPFDPRILKRGRKIAEQYHVVVRYEPEDECWFGRGLELPYAMEDGVTPGECVTKTIEMFVTVVAYMLEEGQTPAAPASL